MLSKENILQNYIILIVISSIDTKQNKKVNKDKRIKYWTVFAVPDSLLLIIFVIQEYIEC